MGSLRDKVNDLKQEERHLVELRGYGRRVASTFETPPKYISRLRSADVTKSKPFLER